MHALGHAWSVAIEVKFWNMILSTVIIGFFLLNIDRSAGSFIHVDYLGVLLAIYMNY
jgi:hypothetical protein